MSSFITVLNPTPFALFDSDSIFQIDADKMVVFVLRSLGESTLSVELTKKDIYACFEQATSMFGAKLLDYQIKSNLASLLGSPTGSNGSINLTNVYIKQNLEFLERQAEPYTSIIGYGTDQDSISGSIDLQEGKQDYDLYTDLKDSNGNTLFSLQPSGSQGKMKIFDVFHNEPSQLFYNSNLSANLIGSGLPIESVTSNTKFFVLPIFEDVLRAGMLEAAGRIRRSNYSYRISGKKIRIFPTPSNIGNSTFKLWVRVGFPSQPAPGISSSGSFISDSTYTDQTLYGVSTPANVPYQVVPYSSINQWGKQWIREMTLALCKELLGLIRTKYETLPIGGENLKLNGDTLLQHGREDKEKLITTITEKLESLTYDKLSTLETEKAESLAKQLALVPTPPTWVIKMYD